MNSIRVAEEFNVPLEEVHKVIENINYVPEPDTKYFKKVTKKFNTYYLSYYLMTMKGYALLYGYFTPKIYIGSIPEDEFWRKISSVRMRDSRSVAKDFNVSHTELKRLLESNKLRDFILSDPDDKVGYWIIDQFDTSNKEKIEVYYSITPMVYETIRRYFEERR